MRYINKTKFESQIAKLKAKNEQLKMRNELRAEKKKYSRFPKLEMSKIFTIYIFLLLNVVVIYSLIAMWHFQDLSYLGTLITALGAECLTFITYCVKAYKAKNSEETLKYVRERDQMNVIEEVAEHQYSPDNGVIDNIEQ